MLKIAGSRNRSGLTPDQFSVLIDLMLKRLDETVTEQATQRFLRDTSGIESKLTLLMKSAITVGDDQAMGACLQLRSRAGGLLDKRQYDAKTCAKLVKWSDKRFGSRLESLSAWLQDTREFLESETASAPEPPGDFARPAEVNCSCPQCNELRAFLQSPKHETGEIKALKDQLIHVRDQVRRDQLDTTSKFDRSTRPFTLRLKKTQASYERAIKQYHSDLQQLASLPQV